MKILYWIKHPIVATLKYPLELLIAYLQMSFMDVN